MKSLNIVILEDEPIIAMDLKDFCEEMGHKVISVCYNLEHALIEVEHNHPNFALVDIRIGHQDDGIVFGQKMSEDFGIPFIYITSFFDEQTLQTAKETYPTGYLVKPISMGGLSAAIQVGLNNFEKWRPHKDSLLEKLKKIKNTELTSREIEIVQHIMSGKTNYEIAEAQFISVNTVKTHIKNIFAKMNINSRGQLIAYLNNHL